jgi:CheY-like chemotaxis protein/anti-sigma regulatory factor (Ser/Thr protein kinase)
MNLTRVSLNRLIEQVVELTRARWSDLPLQKGVVITLQANLAADLPDIMGSETEIRDALTNLVFNAVDAMPEGGILALRTRYEHQPAGLQAEDAPAVHVEVSDTGVGMDEETRRRCLEPFYTTKGERGTGLGLAMVYGMIRRHSADLNIDSAVGQGTTVRLSFIPAQMSLPTEQLAPAARAMNRLRVLLVDDDPLLLKSVKEVLDEDGHSVVAADGGQKGIDLFQAALRDGHPFSLVITDLGMPYVDGRKVAAAVKAQSPQTPVVLLTGWGRRLIAENETPPHVDRILSKPPKLAALRAALAELTAGAVSVAPNPRERIS